MPDANVSPAIVSVAVERPNASEGYAEAKRGRSARTYNVVVTLANESDFVTALRRNGVPVVVEGTVYS